MSKKKYFLDLSIIFAGLILFFTWYHMKFDTVATTALNTYKVYLITMDKKEQFAFDISKGAADMSELLGITYVWVGPEDRSAQEQANLISSAVSSGANAIMLVAIDPVEVAGAVKAAKDKGVKIVYVDAPSTEEAVTTLATDNYAAGKLAGETMLEELKAFGIQSGSIGIVGVTPLTITTTDREQGFRDVIEKDNRFKIIGTVYGESYPDNSQQVTENLIRQNDDLVGLFGTNEGSTIGVGNGIKNSGKKIIGIGFDYTEEIHRLLEEEILRAVFVQNPYTMGYLGMAEAYAALKGFDTGPSFFNTGVTQVSWFDPRLPIN